MNTCIIAGSGDLPKYLASKNTNYLIICINGISKSSDFKNVISTVDLLNLQKIIKILQENKIKDIVFAGKFNRPKFLHTTLSDDVVKLTDEIKYLGDDQLLNKVKLYFEEKGFNLKSPRFLVQHSFKSNQIITNTKSINEDKINYLKMSSVFGKKFLNQISKFDIGQSVVVRGKHIIGVEGLEGTNKLIQRSGELYKKFLKSRDSFGPVLIKLPKLNQTLDLDMPVIGIKTFELAHKYKFLGIAVSNSNVLIMNEKQIRSFCVKENFPFFLMGG